MKRPILISLLVAALVVAYIKTGMLGDCIGIASFAGYALLPFLDRKRVRARLATFTFLFNGLFGMAQATIFLMLHGSCLVVSAHANHVIHSYLTFSGGIFLGVTLTLMFSGQLFPKRDDKEISN